MIWIDELVSDFPVWITFHGTGAGDPSGDRFGSAATLRCEGGHPILIDAGDSVPRRIIADLVIVENIEALFLSHTHPDHWSGIPGLVMAWDISGRTRPATLYLPHSSQSFFQSVLENSWLQARPRSYDLKLQEYATGEDYTVGPVTVRPYRTSHLDRYQGNVDSSVNPFPPHMFNISVAGLSIVFSQDLGTESDLVPYLDRVDLLVCEASHVNLDQAARLAAKSGVKVFIVTHIGPKDAERVARFESVWSKSNEKMRVIVAFDGMEIAIEDEGA